MCECMHVCECVCVCVCVCVFVCLCLCECMCVMCVSVCKYVCMCVRARVCVFANHTVQDGTQSRTDICSVCVCGGGGGRISLQNLPTMQKLISISMILVTF